MSDLTYRERLKLTERGDMIKVYKIIRNIYDHEFVPNLLSNNEMSQRIGNRGHSLKVFTQRAKLSLRKKIPIRIIEPWKGLSDYSLIILPSHIHRNIF